MRYMLHWILHVGRRRERLHMVEMRTRGTCRDEGREATAMFFFTGCFLFI